MQGVIYVRWRGRKEHTWSCKPSNTTLTCRSSVYLFWSSQRHKMDRSSLLDQELPGSRHPGLKKLFRRTEDSHEGKGFMFQICFGDYEVQVRRSSCNRRPKFIYATSNEDTSTHGVFIIVFCSCVHRPAVSYVP